VEVLRHRQRDATRKVGLRQPLDHAVRHVAGDHLSQLLCVAGTPGGRPPSCVPCIVTTAPLGPFRRSAAAWSWTNSGCTNCRASSASPPARKRVSIVSTVLRIGAGSAITRVYRRRMLAG